MRGRELTNAHNICIIAYTHVNQIPLTLRYKNKSVKTDLFMYLNICQLKKKEDISVTSLTLVFNFGRYSNPGNVILGDGVAVTTKFATGRLKYSLSAVN